VIGSCADDEQAMEIDNRGLFTKCFLEAIDPEAEFRSGKGAFRPGNQEATAWEVFHKISDKVAATASERNETQNPQFGSIVDPLNKVDGRKHDGQFVFYRPEKEADKDKIEEKQVVDNMNKRPRGRVSTTPRTLKRLHEDLGGFRYHRLMDVLAASYNTEGLPLDSVADIISLNTTTVESMVEAQHMPLLEIYDVESLDEYERSEATKWIRMSRAALQWCEEQGRATNHKEPPSCPDHKHLYFKGDHCCYGLCKCNEKCRKLFSIWELEDGCSDLLPNVSTGHAILETRIQNRSLSKYRPLASTLHSALAGQTSAAMRRSPKSKILKKIDDIVGGLGPKLKLVWGFSQCISALPIVFILPWPAVLLRLSATIRALTSELLVWILGFSCDFQSGFLPMFIAYLLAMPLLGLVAWFSDICARQSTLCRRFCCANLLKPKDGAERTHSSSTTVCACGQGFWETINDWVLDKGYNPVCTQLFWFWRCRMVQDHYYLLADMRVKCYEGEWTATLFWSVLGVIVFMFGIPLSQLFYMCVNQDHLHSDKKPQDGNLHRKRVLCPRCRVGHHKIQEQMGSLYEQYRPAFWWINILEKFYVLAISGGVVILGDDSVARCLMAILLSAMWILFITYYQPYRAHWDNFLAALLAIELILVLVVGMASSADLPSGAAGGFSSSRVINATSSREGSDADHLFQQAAKDFWIEATSVFVIGLAALIVFGSTPCIKKSLTRWCIRCWPRRKRDAMRLCRRCCQRQAMRLCRRCYDDDFTVCQEGTSTSSIEEGKTPEHDRRREDDVKKLREVLQGCKFSQADVVWITAELMDTDGEVKQIIKEGNEHHERRKKKIMKRQQTHHASVLGRVARRRVNAFKVLSDSQKLQKTKLFQHLSQEAIIKVIRAMEYREFPAGTNIVTQDEPGVEMMVIMLGSADVIRDGKKVEQFQSLDIIGEAALVHDNHIRTADVLATSNVVGVMVLSKDRYDELREDGSIGKDVDATARRLSLQYVSVEELMPPPADES
jgi:hypothetical protein